MTPAHDDVTKLSAPQRKAIMALLTVPSARQAAALAGVSDTSVYRWLKLPHFRQALRDAEDEALRSVSRGLVMLAEDALTVLGDALHKGTMQQKLRAADTVLGHLLRLKEATDIVARLEALEADI